MPKQIGNMPALGAMNNMSYYKSKDGIMVKMKSVISKDKFKTKSFEITHRNNLEFGLAGKAGKTLRNAVQKIILNSKDSRMTSRLTTLLLQIAKTDTTSKHGERNVSKGLLEKLDRFNFNVEAQMVSAFPVTYTWKIDRVSGELSINIPAFDPRKDIPVPDGATHFRLVSAGSEIDFEANSFVTEPFESQELSLQDPAGPFSIVHKLTAASNLPLFLFLGIQFFQEINGERTVIHSTNANALEVVQVDKP